MSRIESSLRCSAQIKSLPEFVRAEYVAAADYIAELEAELKRMEVMHGLAVESRDALARALEDAERYAWLRLRWDGEYAIDLNAVPDSYWAPKAAPDLDTAIDAARNRHD